jgi:hypothetical protein
MKHLTAAEPDFCRRTSVARIVVHFLYQVLPSLALHQSARGSLGQPLNGPSLLDGDGESRSLHVVQNAKSFLPAQPPQIHLFSQCGTQFLQLRVQRIGKDSDQHP